VFVFTNEKKYLPPINNALCGALKHWIHICVSSEFLMS
jgi:hypothetical protein